jgi:Ser/Thr protein kinase RdoA (MazF antagonist)
MLRASPLTDKLGTAASLRYGLSRDAMEFLHYSQNYVFRVQDSRGPSVIVRLTKSDHRNRQEILAELHWIDFLKRHGVKACGAVQPHGRDICETVHVDGIAYFCVLFEHAAGRAITRRDFTPALFEQHGKVTGQLHRPTTYITSGTERLTEIQESRRRSSDGKLALRIGFSLFSLTSPTGNPSPVPSHWDARQAESTRYVSTHH